jgi:hypothetical protein
MNKTFRAVLVASLFAGCTASRPVARPEAAAMCRCTPDKPCWPAAADWQRFGAGLHGKLEQPHSPLEPCRSDVAGEACAAAIKNAKNPFYLQDQAGGTQSTGWLGAWTAATSAFAVVAEDASDIAAAVDFARRHGLRLVIKGTGHDYLGRSNAPDSLLVWTHKMRRVSALDQPARTARLRHVGHRADELALGATALRVVAMNGWRAPREPVGRDGGTRPLLDGVEVF